MTQKEKRLYHFIAFPVCLIATIRNFYLISHGYQPNTVLMVGSTALACIGLVILNFNVKEKIDE